MIVKINDDDEFSINSELTVFCCRIRHHFSILKANQSGRNLLRPSVSIPSGTVVYTARDWYEVLNGHAMRCALMSR